MIVVDASAMVEFLLQTDLGARVEARLFQEDDSLHAPHIVDVEVVQALCNLVRRGEVVQRRAQEALEDLVDVDVIRHPHLDLVRRLWTLRENLTANDAVYVAVAESLDAPLVTCDRPLASSPGHRARIEWIG